MAHFLDTLVLDEVRVGGDEPLVVGFQALASPRSDPDVQPDPGLVLDSLLGLDSQGGMAIEDRERLVRVLTYVMVNPSLVARPDRDPDLDQPREAPFPPELLEWVRAAIDSPLIVVENSPLSKRSIVDLSATATTTGLYFMGQVPVLVLVGGPVGLVVIRGIQGLGAALWEGARPEVVSFGRDLASTYLDLLRTRLGIDH